MNKFFTVLLLLFIIIRGADRFVASIALTSLNDSPHVLNLYEELRTKDPPSERDPARSNPNVRKSICDSIVNSGFLRLMGSKPVDLERMYDDVRHSAYVDLSNMIYTTHIDSDDREYVNEYRQLHLYGPDLGDFTEYVFVCLSRFWAYSEIHPFFVSKEYDVSESELSYKPGRFAFAVENSRPVLVPPIWHSYVLLAEEPGVAHRGAKFNVELYFLKMRKHSHPADSNVFDPLCRLVSDDDDDWNNQHYRLCVAISRSPAYEHRFQYPARGNVSACEYLKVSFKTPQGMEQAVEGSYFERMTACYSELRNEDRTEVTFLYMSRAYTSDQVLVYQLDSADGKIYLENLIENVSVLDELNSFDFVEE